VESLIQLFSPPVPPARIDAALTPSARRVLWAGDSVHRARNLAQLAAALVHMRLRSPDASYLEEMAANAHALAAAYAELAEEQAPGAKMPCADLLQRVVTGLVQLFGNGERPVRLRCSVAELWLTSEQRRALVLIASELVVNALKYAFPETGGNLAVRLILDEPYAELIVEDDGVGLGPAARPGNGSRILDELAVLISAPIERADRPEGGLRVVVRLPLG
jgi:two-component sensor histidine kinase